MDSYAHEATGPSGTARRVDARTRAADSRELEALMAGYVGGDLAAFDALYGHLAPRLHGYLVSLARDRDRADDLLQIAFLKMHHARAAWIPGAAVLPWAFAIARNAFYDDARHAARAPDRPTDTGELPELADLDARAEAEAIGDVDRRVEEIGAALERLHPSQREAFVLTKQMGLSLREAADVLSTTESAVKLRVHRAYVALRKLLAAKEEP